MTEKAGSKYDNDRSLRAIAFLQAYRVLCREHGMSLSHEDSHGGFIVTPLDEGNVSWVMEAAECDDGTYST